MSEERRYVSGLEAYALLQSYGIPVPRHGIAKDEDEAVRIAEEIGYPVVLKVVSPQIVHKSDIGGVVLGVANPQGVRTAYKQILSAVTANASGAEITGILVEKEVSQGLELIIGGKRDPSFGPVLSFGLGGTLVELLRDVSLEVAPFTRESIEGMVRSIRGYPLIGGYRGNPPLDREMLIDIMVKSAEMLTGDPEIREFDINPLVLYERGACGVDARIAYGANGSTRPSTAVQTLPPSWMDPESIAVVGASGDPKKLGYIIFRNLLRYRGRLYAVNPKRAEVLGHPAYASLLDIPGEVDMVVIAVPAKLVPQVLEDAGRRHVKHAVVISAGFRESGEGGRVLEEEIIEISKRHHIRLLGPNCLGIILPHKGINATFQALNPKQGHIALISQSGAIVATIVDWSIPRGIGFSAVISLGNQADLGFEEFLNYFSLDDRTRAVILYVEEIRNGRRFIEVVSGITTSKPVIAIKSGSSGRGREVAASHTGALAGEYEVYLAAFRKSGVIPAKSLKEAFYVAELLASEGYPRGVRAIVITSAGGFAVMASDYAEIFGVRMIDLPPDAIEEMSTFLPYAWNRKNPMDIVGDAGADRYARVFDVMIKYQHLWDIAFVIGIPSATLNPNHLAHEIVRFSRNTENMIVGCLLGGDSVRSGVGVLREHDIPNFEDLLDAFMAVGTVSAWKDRNKNGQRDRREPETVNRDEGQRGT
ncbi:MAG: acetate--CoA ligase family protein [Methanomicrobiales archaeon]|nr:acetate--CoA ligase family protein [Methanomicrobiales archaeon]